MSERAAKILIALAPVLLFFGLFLNYVSVFGEKTVKYEMGDNSPFVQRLLPDERVSEVMTDEHGDTYVELLDEPVYFSVFAPPGDFERVTAKVYFEAEEEAIFELGALKDLFAQAFDLRPFANNILTNLTEQGWLSRPLEGLDVGTVFARTEEALESWSELPATEIATYRKSLPWFSGEDRVRDVGITPFLQGSHEFFLNLSHDPSFTGMLRYLDKNKVAGTDEINIKIYSASGDLVADHRIDDDGNVSADGEASAVSTFELAESQAPGIYRMVISTTSDVNFDFMSSDPFVLKNVINVGSHINNSDLDSVDLYTNAKTITVEPLTADALTVVDFDTTTIVPKAVGEKLKLTSTSDEVSRLSHWGGNIKITGEGFFSPKREFFFAPEAAGFSNFITDPDSFKAVVAQVPEVKMEGDWQVGETAFELSTLAMERGAYKFVLSAPQVEEENGGVKVHAMELTFEKDVSLRSVLSSLKRFIKELVF